MSKAEAGCQVHRNRLTLFAFNPDLRQLLHVGYKSTVELEPCYRNAVTAVKTFVELAITQNLLERHIARCF